MPLNTIAAGSQPAATIQDAGNASSVRTDYSTNANPMAGPYFLARLLANLPVTDAQIGSTSVPWQSLGLALLATPNQERVRAFEDRLKDSPQGDSIRQAVFAMDPTAPLPEMEISPGKSSDFPELPQSVRPPEQWQTDQAGIWLKDYLAFASQAAPMSDVAFHLSAGLYLLSTAIARRVYIQAGVQRIYPNLYQLIVAKSTLHHKTTALAVAESVMKEAGLDLLLLASRHTPESLVSEMGTTRPATFEAWSTNEKQRWLSERAFSAQRGWMLDEASHLMDSFNRDYSAGLLPLVLALYDCPEREVSQTIGRGRQAVLYAYLSILGATTPGAINEHVQRGAHWNNGLWARFALVTPQKNIPDWHFFPDTVETPKALADHLNKLAFSKLPVTKVEEVAGEVRVAMPQAISAVISPEVFEAWERYAKAIGYDLLLEGGVDHRLWPSYGRLYISAMKVAMLLAVSDWTLQNNPDAAPVIHLSHWWQAQAIAETWRESAHRLLNDFGAGEERDREEQLLRVLRRASSTGMTAREIGQLAHMKRDAVEMLLINLEQDGVIERLQVPGQRVLRFHMAIKV